MRKLVGLMVVAAIAAAVVAGTAEATKPQPQTLQLSGVLTGPDTISGTWRGHGVVEDAGTYTETFRFVGDTIKVDKVLVGARGTITLHVHAVVVWLSACTATFSEGSWRVVDGSGAYEELRGHGSPATSAASFGDVCTGQVEIEHVGRARLG